MYAPGATGYKPIALSLEPQPGVVLRETHYPKSEVYFFQPLDERVPVFQRPFRVVQDVMLDADAQLFRPANGVNPDVHPLWEPEFFGDIMLVNGVPS